MAEISTSATVEGEKVSTSVDYNFGATIDEAIKEFGEDTVYGLYARGATLCVQQKVGAMLRAGVGEDTISSEIAGYRLDQRGVRVRKSKEDKVQALFAGMDNEQIANLLSGMGIKVK